MMTERAYYDDPYRKEWEAIILRRARRGDRIGLVLDVTYFYPGGGGQPADKGWIGGKALLDITEEDELYHWVSADPGEGPVACVLDWNRRMDLMQQHTGQHILSASFESELNAATVSFHLADAGMDIDVGVTELTEDDLRRVEREANRVVLSDLPVGIHIFEPGQPIHLPLRKPPTVSGPVRIVAVEGVDYSPCGGTHCRRTGEVGLIKILRAEHRGKETRIHFLCGWRALEDYGRKHAIVSTLAGRFSVGDAELADSVIRLEDEAKTLRRELNHAQERIADIESAQLLAEAETIGGARVVSKVFDDRGADAIRRLAARLTEQGGCVALLACRGEKIQVVFARSADVGYDMAALLRQVSPLFGGRGGGQPHLAQGGGTDAMGVEEALRQAVDLLKGK